MKKISSLLIVFTLIFFAFTTESVKPTLSENIRLNQIGYYPNSVKEFVLVDTKATHFEIINAQNKSVFKGKLVDKGVWKTSGEKVLMGNFTELKSIGKYSILIDGKLTSYPFEIKDNLYDEALKASIKSYYFQRASMFIEKKYGGIYSRKAGHMDNQCIYHPSSGHSNGTLNSPGGWYDAGDYGKYIVNASFSVGQMLELIEIYPNAIKDNSLNIPESGNGISDLLDELKYELNWIITMQDKDGGVYHKLTAKKFGGFIMPEAYDIDRYIIGKATAATLDFAAVLAQSSRLYKNIDSKWSETALIAAEKAWAWAQKNPNTAFKNPEDVVTGEYGDKEFSDDFYWAATELYLTTKNKQYFDALNKYKQPYKHQLTNSWMFFVRNNAFHSLLINKEVLDKDFSSELIKDHIKLANQILNDIEKNPYHLGLELYEWGSNSDVLNQAMILCYAHRLTNDEKYLNGAEQITDYVFGKNATGYSFLTGFGSKKAMFPHHRPSGADGIANPVPGFIIGGPNKDQQDAHEVEYSTTLPAKSYMDVEPSFASNEVCINWNAPAVFVLGYIQQTRGQQN